MRDNGRAFFSEGSYRLAGVLLRKEDTLERDSLPALDRDGASSEEGGSGDEHGSASDSSTASTGAAEKSLASHRTCCIQCTQHTGIAFPGHPAPGAFDALSSV